MLFVAAFAFNGPLVRGRRAFGVLALLVGLWCVTAAAEYLVADFTLRRFLGQSVYLGAAGVPVAWFIFALRYTGHDRWLHWPVIAMLSVLPLLTAAVAFTNDWHGLIWSSVRLELEPIPDLVVEHGPWFRWVHVPFSYGLFLLGLLALISRFSGEYVAYRRQLLGLLASATIIFVTNVAYVFGDFNVYGVDPSPMFMAVFTIGLALSLFSGFLGSSPLSYREIFIASGEGVVMLDGEGRIVDINPAAQALAGEQPALGSRLAEALPWLHEQALQAGVERTVPHQERVLRLRRVPLTEASGRLAGAAIIIRDATAEAQEREILESLATHDSLTKILNRHAFLELLETRYLANRDPRWPLMLLYIDLDRFKPVNDRFGHAVGDQLLVEVARRLQQALRPGDVLGRIGGDEFAAILDRADAQVAEQVIQRLLRALAKPFPATGEAQVVIGASIGTATWPLDGERVETLLEAADKRMYDAKRRRPPLS